MYQEEEVIWRQQQIWIAHCCCHSFLTEWQIIHSFYSNIITNSFFNQRDFFLLSNDGIITGIIVWSLSKNNLIFAEFNILSLVHIVNVMKNFFYTCQFPGNVNCTNPIFFLPILINIKLLLDIFGISHFHDTH